MVVSILLHFTSLSYRYAFPLLVELLNKEKVYKTQLRSVVTTLQTLDNLIEALEEDGLLEVEKVVERGLGVTKVTLTELGEIIGRQFSFIDSLRVNDNTRRELTEIISEVKKAVEENEDLWHSEFEFVFAAVLEKLHQLEK